MYRPYSELICDLSQKVYGDFGHFAEMKLALAVFCREMKDSGLWDRRLDPHHQLSRAGFSLLRKTKGDILDYLRQGQKEQNATKSP